MKWFGEPEHESKPASESRTGMRPSTLPTRKCRGPLRTEATPFGEAHLVALGPEIAKTCLPCPSVTV